MSFELSFSPEADTHKKIFTPNDLSCNPNPTFPEGNNSHFHIKEIDRQVPEEQEKFTEEASEKEGGPGAGRRYQHIFRNDCGVNPSLSRSSVQSSSSSLLDLMSKPSPSEIRRWMADTQETVDKVVTNWQEDLIDISTEIVELLDELIQFVCCLDGSSETEPPLPSLLNVKLVNAQGTFESAINVYLHVIFLAVEQVTDILEKMRLRSKDKAQYQQSVMDVLNQFSLIAEDALKFLKTDEKLLVPVCSRVLEMRNQLFGFLRSATQQPPGQIIPIGNNVSLKKIRMKEDNLWLQSNFLERFSKEMEQYTNGGYDLLRIKVMAKNFIIILQNNTQNSCEEHRELGTDNKDHSAEENLELIQLLLIQLRNCISSSNRTCRRTTHQLSSLHSSITRKFQVFTRSLNLERRLSRLKAENCCSSLKKSLCQLEVKFHQVEKILEDIPEHMKRVIGIADLCSRQLILRLGLDDQISELGDWTSPIEGISEEFFTKRKGLLGCFPYLWRLIARLLLGSSSGSPTKLEEFWDQVRAEVEDYQKEVKVKEMEEEQKYVLTMTIPLMTRILEGNIRIDMPFLSKLAFHRPRKLVEPMKVVPTPDSTKEVNVRSPSPPTLIASTTQFQMNSVPLLLSGEPITTPSKNQPVSTSPLPRNNLVGTSMEPFVEDAALLEEINTYITQSPAEKKSANDKSNNVKSTAIIKNIHNELDDLKLKYTFDNYIIASASLAKILTSFFVHI